MPSSVEKGAIIVQGFPGDEDFTDAIFGRVAHIVEGFSGVEFFTVGNEQKTAIFEDTGVGSVLGMSIFDSPLVILKSRRLSTRAADRGSRSFPNKVSATQPVED